MKFRMDGFGLSGNGPGPAHLIDRHQVGFRGLPVLMYHSIPGRMDDPGCLPVPLADFRRQVQLLVSQGAVVLGLTQALARKAADPAGFVVALTFDDGFADVLNAAEVLGELGGSGTAYVCPGLLSSGRDRGRANPFGAVLLSARQVAELASAGMEIGSHTMTHRPLDVLPDAQVWDEVRESKIRTEQLIGTEVRSFCYPHGYAGPRARRAVIAAGYANACIVGRRVARRAVDSFTIPRLQAVAESDELFLRRIRKGEPGLRPHLKRAAMPAWRGVRRVTARLTGRVLA